MFFENAKEIQLLNRLMAGVKQKMEFEMRVVLYRFDFSRWMWRIKNGFKGVSKRRPFKPFLESLETRVVMASDSFLLADSEMMAPDVLWAPDTPQSVVDNWQNQFAALGGFVNGVEGSRWTSTATDGSGLTQGHPSTLTWSIPPDGTTLGTGGGEANTPSNFRSMLNGLYGSISTWLPVIQQVFDRWEATSGIDFVYELNDDGAAYSNANRGFLGVRGDIRVSGHALDGPSNILAYNYFPNFGEMVLDTADTFYSTLTSNSLRLRNVLAHETGHGIGLSHTLPQNGTKLMEPAANLNFDGPQADDILRANRAYGDRLENNDSIALASGLGTVGSSTIQVSDISIDDNSDLDFFSFNVSSASILDISINPLGSTYTIGLEGGSTELFDSKANSDLAFSLLASNGTTVIASANLTGLGGNESLIGVSLSPGQYFLRITGAQDAAQMYRLSLSASTSGPDTTPPTVTNRTPAPGATVTSATTNIDVTFSEAVQGVDVTDLVLTGTAAASAVKGTPTNLGSNTWRFPISGLVNGPLNVSLAPDANDIEDLAGNDLAALAWTYTVNISVAQQPPVLAAIPDQVMPTSQNFITLSLSATDPNGDSLTFTATAQSAEYNLDQSLGLGFAGGNEYFNYSGLNEKWMTGTAGTWFYITPNGSLYRWNGGIPANDTLIASLSSIDYSDTSLLWAAAANNAPAIVSVSGNTLTINPNLGYVGYFYVTVVVSDGQGGTDTKTFKVTVT